FLKFRLFAFILFSHFGAITQKKAKNAHSLFTLPLIPSHQGRGNDLLTLQQLYLPPLAGGIEGGG
ncbi:MAG: hypothetical protein P8185_24835, partial [Deltaproteobacteria bacterium]